MSVELIDDPARFLTEAGTLLLADEARHNLILGIAGLMRSMPDVYPDRSLWLVYDGAVVAAALRTPPYNVVLARPLDDAALHELADAIDELPGVVGAVPEVDAFAERWCGQHGCGARLVFAQGVFALREVAELPRASGSRREATEDDYDLLLDWFLAFGREALHEGEPGTEQHERQIRQRLDSDDGGIALGGRRRRGVTLRLRLPDAERDPDRAGLHSAGAPRPRVCDDADGGCLSRAARTRTPVLLPLHRPREPDLECDLRADRLRPRLRVEAARVRELGELPAAKRLHGHRPVGPRALEEAAKHALGIGGIMGRLDPRTEPTAVSDTPILVSDTTERS